MSARAERRPVGQALTPEDRAIGADVLLRHLRREPANSLPALTETQWDAVVSEAIRQRVAPLAFRRIKAGPAHAVIPPPALQRLADYHLRSSFRNVLVLRQAASAAQLLATRGIPVIFLKGVHLAGWIYPEAALRSMADIDLMVPRERLADAEQIFVEAGFGPLPRPDFGERLNRYAHIAPLRRKGSLDLEVHYSIERPTSPFRIDVAQLWERSRQAVLEETPVRLLSAEDLLLHLCLHASYHHRYDRSPLKGLLDVAAVVTRHEADLDWVALVGRARQWGATRFVYCTLRLAREVLDAPIPVPALEPLGPESADEEVIAIARHFIVTPPAELPRAYQELREKRGIRDRLAWLTRNIFLPPDRLRRLYGLRPGSPLVYAYYLVRPFDLLIRRGVLLARVALRTRELRPTLERERSRDRINDWVDRADDEPSRRAAVNGSSVPLG